MLNTRREPSACDPRIGNALRQLRQKRLLLAGQVAETTGWSESKVSRIEKARIPVTLADLERLLDLYQVDELSRNQLLDTARTAAPVRDLSPVLRASVIRDWSPAVIPEPLRAAGYAHAVLESLQPVISIRPSQVTAAIDDIASAQNRLITGTPPLQLHVVLGEAALGNGFGTPETMRAQIGLLIQLAGLPNVDISIARFGLRNGPRAVGEFSVLSFEPVLGYPTPDKVLLPGIPRPAEVDDERETWPLRVAFGLLQDAADSDVANILKRHYAKWGS